MAVYVIFNGDADGLCALHQLRLARPRHDESRELITGVKRDIQLLSRPALRAARAGDEITVLDISHKSNAAALAELLARGVKCQYFDHHAAGMIPVHANLDAHIDTAPEVCTSLIVDKHLAGAHRLWAVVAAFGDNLVAPALRAAQPLDLDHTELARLHELGDCLNYNAYGDTTIDAGATLQVGNGGTTGTLGTGAVFNNGIGYIGFLSTNSRATINSEPS